MRRNLVYKLATAITINLIVLTTVDCQMVPISEVKTHPPSPTSSDSRKTPAKTRESDPRGGRPFGQDKINAHAKIAASHLREQEEELTTRPASFPTVEHDEHGRKIIRKDKDPELQNPSKHSSDQNLLNFLIEQYKQITSSSTSPDLELQIELLTNIQYFTHKFENGRDLFQSTNALETILLPGLNSTYFEVRQSICSIFAIAGQNNIVVQELAMKSGVLRQLIHIISVDAIVRPKALYALSSLLRNYEDGQLKFMQDGGVQILVNIAFLSETRQKSLTLLIDLIKEQKYTSSTPSSNEEEETPSSPASDNHKNLIISSLKHSEWCELLVENIQNLEGFGQDDQILIIDAIYSSLELNVCHVQSFNNFHSHFKDILSNLEKSNEENSSAAETNEDDFVLVDDELINGIELLKSIINKISKNQELKVDRDEL